MMAEYISQLLKVDVVVSILKELGYDDGCCGKILLNTLDDFLKSYVTANEVNGTEPYGIGQDEEALADIITEWLDAEGNGRRFWPCPGIEDNSSRLRYDAGDHGM